MQVEEVEFETTAAPTFAPFDPNGTNATGEEMLARRLGAWFGAESSPWPSTTAQRRPLAALAMSAAQTLPVLPIAWADAGVEDFFAITTAAPTDTPGRTPGVELDVLLSGSVQGTLSSE